MKLVNGLIGATLVVTLTGCNLIGTAQGKVKTVVIDDDVALHSTMDDTDVAISKSERIALSEKITYDNLLRINNDEMFYTKDHSFYKTDISNQKQTLLKELSVREVSRDASRALIMNNDGVFVYNLESDKIVKVSQPMDSDFSFADPKGKYISFHNFDKSNYVFINTTTLKKTELNYKKLFNLKDVSLSNAIAYNDLFYISSQSPKDGYAIYKLSTDHQKELVLQLPHQNDHIAYFEFLNDQTIIFNGSYNEESGIFIYDLEKQVVTKVVSGGVDSEGTWTPFYSISPDGTKILFDTVVHEDDKFFNNIYLANIEGNKLSKSIQIIEKAQLPAVISLMAHWSEDSSTFYIPGSNKGTTVYSNEAIDFISIYVLDKIKVK
ncbi:MAG TPA: hypothetical protein VEV44_00790 [Pseudoneobacillus sp.]|nr:hypothetical protein [Pseudoneobacillus sp.]